MRKVALAIGLVLFTFHAFSQTETDNKNVKFGFNLGLHHSNLRANEKLPSNAQISNGFGFRLGLLADIHLTKNLTLSPKSEMAFNNSKVQFTQSDGIITEYKVMPISLEFMSHLTIKTNHEKARPYFLIGPNFKLPITKKTETTTAFKTRSDLAIDFGIGMEKSLPYFHFAPELRYSYGLLNVNAHPAINSLNFHTLTLAFNFY